MVRENVCGKFESEASSTVQRLANPQCTRGRIRLSPLLGWEYYFTGLCQPDFAVISLTSVGFEETVVSKTFCQS